MQVVEVVLHLSHEEAIHFGRLAARAEFAAAALSDIVKELRGSAPIGKKARLLIAAKLEHQAEKLSALKQS